MRINRASDDAAGLALSTRLGAHSRIYNQAIRNVNDGLSALNVAQGALGEMRIITTRLRELSEQSANGTFSSTQRSALNEEAGQLIDEYNRIVRSSSFNNRQLLDGTLSNLSLQLGFGTVSFSIGSEMGNQVGSGTFDSQIVTGSTARAGTIAAGDLNGDGYEDNVTIRVSALNTTTVYIQLSNGDGTFTESTRSLTATNGAAVELADINNDNKLDIVVYGYRDQTTIFRVRSDYMLGNGDGTFGTANFSLLTSIPTTAPTLGDFTLADINGDGNLDLVDSYYENVGGMASVNVRLGNGTGAFTAGTAYSLDMGEPAAYAITAADFNQDNRMDIVFANAGGFLMMNDGSGNLLAESLIENSAFAVDTGDLNGDGISDVVFGGANGTVSYLSSGSGTSPLSQYASTNDGINTLELADINGDGVLDVVTGESTHMGTGDGSFGAAIAHTWPSGAWTLADVNNDGVHDFLTTRGASSGVAALLGLTDTVTTLSPVSIATQADALEALDSFKTLGEKLGKELGSIGSHQSRLQSALGSLYSTRDGYSAAFSRIQDADIAQESASLIRNQILQQTANAVLSQANLLPEIALSLLRQIG